MYMTKAPDDSVTRYDTTQAYDGYTLFAPHGGTDAWLIDMEGRICHRWRLASRPGSGTTLLPNGNLLVLSKTGKEPTTFLGTGGGELHEIDWDGNVVWRHEDEYMHHDFKRLDSGNTLLNRHVLIPEEIARTVRGGIPGTEHESGMWGNAYREVTPGGETVWEWRGYEHMDPEVDVPCALCPRSIWGYVNGIDTTPDGDVVGSFRHLNNLVIADRTSGDIKWRWGTWELGHQHNPTVLDSGNILVLDNGYHRLPPRDLRTTVSAEGYSRVLEVNPQTDQIEWSYEAEPPTGFWSHICSSAQRLPNGNTVVCESGSGRLFEVTEEGKIVWQFISPFYADMGRYGLTNLVYKAKRYGAEDPALAGKDLAPRKYDWVLHRTFDGIGDPVA
jgi:hypothetical protein